MIIFNVKKEYFEKIKTGERTHEYKEVKPYWTKRLMSSGDIFFNTSGYLVRLNEGNYSPELNLECEFINGKASKNKVKGVIKTVTMINGSKTDLATDKTVYDIRFELAKKE